MANERSAIIKIGDKEYELLLTTKATKEIAKKIEADTSIVKVLSWKECKEVIDNIDQS